MFKSGGRLDIDDSRAYSKLKTIHSSRGAYHKIVGGKLMERLDQLLHAVYPNINFPNCGDSMSRIHWPRKRKFPNQSNNECGLAILRFMEFYDGDEIKCDPLGFNAKCLRDEYLHRAIFRDLNEQRGRLLDEVKQFAPKNCRIA